MQVFIAEATPPASPAEACDASASTYSRLAPLRHRQCDFFVADILDASPKDDLASMEHPLFALRAGDRRIRVYERKETRVTVKPGVDGCATIHDKDLWIYCISQLVAAKNRGREITRTVRFTAYDSCTRPIAIPVAAPIFAWERCWHDSLAHASKPTSRRPANANAGSSG